MDNHTPESIPLKQCTKCQEWKPATTEHFARKTANKSGLKAQCKVCISHYSSEFHAMHKEELVERQRRIRAANPERAVEYQRKYYAANRKKANQATRKWQAENPDRKRQTAQNYYFATLEKKRAYQRAYRAANTEKLRQAASKYHAANPDKVRAGGLRRRAIQRAAVGHHTRADITRQYKAQKGKCYYCGCELGDRFHTDHVIPLSRGGSDGPENIVVACPACNRSKANKMPHEWEGSNRLL